MTSPAHRFQVMFATPTDRSSAGEHDLNPALSPSGWVCREGGSERVGRAAIANPRYDDRVRSQAAGHAVPGAPGAAGPVNGPGDVTPPISARYSMATHDRHTDVSRTGEYLGFVTRRGHISDGEPAIMPLTADIGAVWLPMRHGKSL